MALNPELEKISIEVSLREKDFGEASARFSKAQTTGFDATSWRDQLWLAEVQAILGRRARKRRPQRRRRHKVRGSGEGLPPRVEFERKGRGKLDLVRAVLRQHRSARQGQGSGGRGDGKNCGQGRPGRPAQCYEVLRDAEQLQKKTDEAADDGKMAQKKYEEALAAAPTIRESFAASPISTCAPANSTSPSRC